jgi:hypothetical protein
MDLRHNLSGPPVHADKSVADGASNAVVTFKDFSSFESKAH